MKTIYKYPIDLIDIQYLEVPRLFSALTVQKQNEKPCLWLLVNNDEITVKIEIHTYGTGQEIIFDDLCYIGTYQSEGGMFVFHVFWRYIVE